MTFTFTPVQEDKKPKVPYFEDVSRDGGWKGYTTSKTIIELQSQIAAAIGRLGGMVVNWNFVNGLVDDQERYGYEVFITITEDDGNYIPGKFFVTALPIKTPRAKKNWEGVRDRALRLALFNLRDQFENEFMMQILIPGHSALMPFMIDAASGQPLYMVFAEHKKLNNLLPAITATGDEETIDGEFAE